MKDNPLFRREPPPWYDTIPMLVVSIFLSAGVFLFGATGLSVAFFHPAYQRSAWVPSLLVILSTYLFVYSIVRFVKRWRFPDRRI
ncbi:MAG: hypothetical protein ACLFOY_09490 [Desulfatibacillaceae bacterium]